MIPLSKAPITAVACLLMACANVNAQTQTKVWTPKGETFEVATPHPLTWWTNDPLRLDASGDLMIGIRASDGNSVTARDYSIDQKLTRLGTIAGHRTVQIITTIRPGSRVIASGWASKESPPAQWKMLLAQIGSGDSYLEIYRLQAEANLFPPLKAAAIYGVGSDAVLGTYDPDSGVGGGCADGYWWFDQHGAHEVDFSPLLKAISVVIPANSRYSSRCSALHPATSELETGVQSNNAECQACGGLGHVKAKYTIKRGLAFPVSVHFEPEQ